MCGEKRGCNTILQLINLAAQLQSTRGVGVTRRASG